MKPSKRKYRAIDLYSGIGGWSLGLEMAGIDVVGSYEWWSSANTTNYKNNNHPATEIDIRQLRLESLPSKIDIVVGSPPCTQFSYANRGGNGDIADGLKDIAKFLEIVAYLKPKYWAMENVPRVLGIIQKEMASGGTLERFSYLQPQMEICDTSDWGVPQRRLRCIVGNFDFSLLGTYKAYTTKRTLRDVIASLNGEIVTDPNYEFNLPRQDLFDNEIEPFLSDEEERINREGKTFHPVYNNMAFPDLMDRPARTVTATCTRVSRESIVINAPEAQGKFRRLSVRERGCLQGFPITYQFFGESYAQKLKMIGNAVPPIFTFYIAQAMLGTKPTELTAPCEAIKNFVPSVERPKSTRPEKPGNSFPPTRRFRAAIPNLRFKSGVRFEFTNEFKGEQPAWEMKFFYGNSKNIANIRLDNELAKNFRRNKILTSACRRIETALQSVFKILETTNAANLQGVWTHSGVLSCHPYEVVDAIGVAAEIAIGALSAHSDETRTIISAMMEELGSPKGTDKLVKHSSAVLAGFLIGTAVNECLRSAAFNGLNEVRLSA